MKENENSYRIPNILEADRSSKRDSSTESIKSEEVSSSINNIAIDSAQSRSNISLECPNEVLISSKGFDEPTVNTNYRSNKNSKEKGLYSECPEVLNKNLLRSIRRHLKELYITHKSNIQSLMKSNYVSKRNMIIKFYNEFMKNHSQSAENVSQEDEIDIMHILSIFLQENIAFVDDKKKHRILKRNINNLIKTYTRKLFDLINDVPEFRKFILVLKEAGILAQMIESYPTLNRSKQAYEIAIEEIIQVK